jgi:hypothetical protein
MYFFTNKELVPAVIDEYIKKSSDEFSGNELPPIATH